MKKIAFVSLALALGACQTAAPTYHAATTGSGSGYYSTSVGNMREAVKYTGAKGMGEDEVARFALLRAAELTLESGHEWFAVLHSQTREVTAGQAVDLQGRAGPVLSTGSTTPSTGASGDRPGSPGVNDASVPNGPSTGGFGGGDVPYQVLERWNAPKVTETVLLIQMGSGDEANFEGLESTPQIMSAQTVVDEIRAEMAG